VHAGQHADLDRDRADRRVVAAVGALAAQDRLALAVLDDVADDLGEGALPDLLLRLLEAGRRR